jgi:hypothetical protein
VYFASHFNFNINYNVAKLKHLESIVDDIMGLDSLEAKDEAEGEMLRLSKPSIWNVYMDGNAEIKNDVGFETFLFTVSEQTKEDLDKITVYKFYSLLEYIKSKKDGR